MAAIRNEGIEITPMNRYCISEESEKKYENALVFGYGNTPIESMAAGVKCLAGQIKLNQDRIDFCTAAK